MTTVTLNISENLYHRLQEQAKANKQTVDEFANQTLSRFLPAKVEVEDDLPPTLHDELKAMEQLSDAALWSLARGEMRQQELEELEMLAEVLEKRPLTEEERHRQVFLLSLYDELLLRRSHAAVLLKARGYNITDTTLLQSQ